MAGGPVQPRFAKGDRVAHTRTADGLVRLGTVVGVHTDDAVNGLYYTVRVDGDQHELQATEHKLKSEAEHASSSTLSATLDHDRAHLQQLHSQPPPPQHHQQHHQHQHQPPEWSLDPALRAKYAQVFASVQHDGRLAGQAAVNFFMQSGLSEPAIRALFHMVDLDRDGALSENEFCAAFHIAVGVKKGLPFPSSLPPELEPTCAPRREAMPSFAPTSSSHPPLGAASTGLYVPYAAGHPTMPPQSHPSPQHHEPTTPPPSTSAGEHAQGHQPSSGSADLDDFAIAQGRLEQYKLIFQQQLSAQPGRGDQLQPDAALAFFRQSGLADQSIYGLFQLVNADAGGALRCEEFCVAFHLAVCAKKGRPIPPSLPETLVALLPSKAHKMPPSPPALAHELPQQPSAPTHDDTSGGQAPNHLESDPFAALEPQRNGAPPLPPLGSLSGAQGELPGMDAASGNGRSVADQRDDEDDDNWGGFEGAPAADLNASSPPPALAPEAAVSTAAEEGDQSQPVWQQNEMTVHHAAGSVDANEHASLPPSANVRLNWQETSPNSEDGGALNGQEANPDSEDWGDFAASAPDCPSDVASPASTTSNMMMFSPDPVSAPVAEPGAAEDESDWGDFAEAQIPAPTLSDSIPMHGANLGAVAQDPMSAFDELHPANPANSASTAASEDSAVLTEAPSHPTSELNWHQSLEVDGGVEPSVEAPQQEESGTVADSEDEWGAFETSQGTEEDFVDSTQVAVTVSTGQVPAFGAVHREDDGDGNGDSDGWGDFEGSATRAVDVETDPSTMAAPLATTFGSASTATLEAPSIITDQAQQRLGSLGGESSSLEHVPANEEIGQVEDLTSSAGAEKSAPREAKVEVQVGAEPEMEAEVEADEVEAEVEEEVVAPDSGESEPAGLALARELLNARLYGSALAAAENGSTVAAVATVERDVHTLAADVAAGLALDSELFLAHELARARDAGEDAARRLSGGDVAGGLEALERAAQAEKEAYAAMELCAVLHEDERGGHKMLGRWTRLLDAARLESALASSVLRTLSTGEGEGHANAVRSQAMARHLEHLALVHSVAQAVAQSVREARCSSAHPALAAAVAGWQAEATALREAALAAGHELSLDRAGLDKVGADDPTGPSPRCWLTLAPLKGWNTCWLDGRQCTAPAANLWVNRVDASLRRW